MNLTEAEELFKKHHFNAWKAKDNFKHSENLVAQAAWYHFKSALKLSGQMDDTWHQTIPDKWEYQEYKPGCLQIRNKGSMAPHLLIVKNNLIGEYLELSEAYDGDLRPLIEEKNSIKEELGIGQLEEE